MSLYSPAEFKNPFARMRAGSAEERRLLWFKFAFVFLALTSVLSLLMVVANYISDLNQRLPTWLLFRMENVEAKVLVRVFTTTVFVSLMWIARRGRNRTILWCLLLAVLCNFISFGAIVWTKADTQLFAWWAVLVGGQGAPLILLEMLLLHISDSPALGYLLEGSGAKVAYLFLAGFSKEYWQISMFGCLHLADSVLLFAFYVWALVRQPYPAANRGGAG